MKLFGMEFNATALKAWVGGVITGTQDVVSQGNGVGGWITGFVIGAFENGTGFDLPGSFEVAIASGVSWLIGYTLVYWTSNKPATP